MSSGELIFSLVLAVALPVALLAWPVASAPVDGAAKVVALLVPAFIAFLIALVLWWLTQITSGKQLKSSEQ